MRGELYVVHSAGNSRLRCPLDSSSDLAVLRSSCHLSGASTFEAHMIGLGHHINPATTLQLGNLVADRGAFLVCCAKPLLTSFGSASTSAHYKVSQGLL